MQVVICSYSANRGIVKTSQKSEINAALLVSGHGL